MLTTSLSLRFHYNLLFVGKLTRMIEKTYFIYFIVYISLKNTRDV